MHVLSWWVWNWAGLLRSEIERLKKGREQIEKEIEQLKRDNALLEWIESEIDLIEADLPSERPIAAGSSDR